MVFKFYEFDEFERLKLEENPILCLDIGSKRIGVAVSDRGWKLASPAETINHKKFTQTAEQIFKLYDEASCFGIVIGLPLEMDGGENNIRCQSIKQFARNLLKIREVPIYFQDERFSTVAAEEVLSHSHVSRDKKNAMVDKIAASHILQSFLDKVSK